MYTYQGREYDDISVDEVTQHEWEVIRILRSSLRTTNPNIKPRMFLTGNPGGPGHDEVKRIFVDRAFDEGENPDDYCFVPAFVSDNQALLSADPEYQKRLEDLPERLRKAYLEGSWEIADDKAFKVFSRVKHVIPPLIPRKYSIILSMDWGIANTSKFAAYLTAVIPLKTKSGEAFNRIITFKEWKGSERTPDEWADMIFDDCRTMGIKPSKCYPDAAMMARLQDGSIGPGKQMMNRWASLNNGDHWLSFTPMPKNRVARIAMTHNWLATGPDGLPYALMTENCSYLIDSLPKLRWDPDKLDEIAEGDDHGWDGWSYGIIQVKYTSVRPGAIEYSKGVPKERVKYNEANEELAIDVREFSRQYEDWHAINRFNVKDNGCRST